MTGSPSEIADEKEEVETNHPSASSNFYSKNSSRVAQGTSQPNEPDHNIAPKGNWPGLQSRNVEVQSKESDDAKEL